MLFKLGLNKILGCLYNFYCIYLLEINLLLKILKKLFILICCNFLFLNIIFKKFILLKNMVYNI